MSRLIATGAVMIDVVLVVPHLPQPGGDVVATSCEASVGGGFNVLAAAHRDGLAGVFAGRTGTGPWSDLVLADLAREDINSWHAPVPDLDNGICVVLVNDTAERTFVTAPGAEEVVTTEHLVGVPVADDDVVHVSGYALASPTRSLPLAAWVSALPIDPRVVLDPSPLIGQVDRGVLRAVLDRTDVLTCNAREAAILLGTDSTSLGEVAAALRALMPPTSVAILRDGARGTWVSGPGRADAWRVPAYDVVAVDTNGAGDTHTGVLMAALARGAALEGAVARANVAAALAVTRRGPASAPQRAEIDQAMRSYLSGTTHA